MKRGLTMTRKRFALALIGVLLCLIFCGCGKDSSPESGGVTDFEALLRQDAFPPESLLLKALGLAVSYSDIRDNGETITFTLTAPDISGELLAWYDARDSVTEAELEAKILELLEGQTQTYDLSLAYTRSESGRITFTYTEEYLSAASCGVRAFYAHLADRVLAGGGGNG